MKLHIKSALLTSVALSTIAVSGCKSTQSYNDRPNREVGYSVLPMSVTVAEDFTALHAQIQTKLALTQSSTRFELVPLEAQGVSAFQIDMPSTFYWKASAFRDDSLLKHVVSKTCKGRVFKEFGRDGKSRMSFADLFAGRTASMQSYGATAEEENTFRSRVRSGTLLSVSVSRKRQSEQLPQASPVNSSDRLIDTSILAALAEPVYEYRQSSLLLESQSHAHGIYLCIIDNKIESALMLNEILSFKDGVAGNNALYVSHYSESFFDRTAPNIIERLVRWADRNERAQVAVRERQQRLRNIVEEINVEHAKVWEQRNTAKYTVGDRVCSYSNLVGNVEQVANDQVKVLWTRELDEQKGFFFGNAYPSDYDHESKMFKYQFRETQRLDWVNFGDIAECTITVK